ncbi:glutathione S-transferase T3-like protein [Tanacetum coccineum]
MGGSSSQRRTNPPMSSIHAFSFEEMYSPEFSNTFQQNISSFQEPAREDSPVEAITTSPPTTKNSTRGRQKRTIQSDDATRQTAWTHEEELRCVKAELTFPKTSCLTVRPAVVRFCGVYGNVMRRMQTSGASDADYYASALMHYEAETGTTFKLRHCWEILKDSPKWQQSELPKFAAKSRGGSKRFNSSSSSSFNTESGEASINLNTNVGDDDDEDEVQEIRRPISRDKARNVAKKKRSRASGSSSMNDEALAWLMVTELTSQEKEQSEAFFEIK